MTPWQPRISHQLLAFCAEQEANSQHRQLQRSSKLGRRAISANCIKEFLVLTQTCCPPWLVRHCFKPLHPGRSPSPSPTSVRGGPKPGLPAALKEAGRTTQLHLRVAGQVYFWALSIISPRTSVLRSERIQVSKQPHTGSRTKRRSSRLGSVSKHQVGLKARLLCEESSLAWMVASKRKTHFLNRAQKDRTMWLLLSLRPEYWGSEKMQPDAA